MCGNLLPSHSLLGLLAPPLSLHEGLNDLQLRSNALLLLGILVQHVLLEHSISGQQLHEFFQRGRVLQQAQAINLLHITAHLIEPGIHSMELIGVRLTVLRVLVAPQVSEAISDQLLLVPILDVHVAPEVIDILELLNVYLILSWD